MVAIEIHSLNEPYNGWVQDRRIIHNYYSYPFKKTEFLVIPLIIKVGDILTNPNWFSDDEELFVFKKSRDAGFEVEKAEQDENDKRYKLYVYELNVYREAGISTYNFQRKEEAEKVRNEILDAIKLYWSNKK